MKNVISTLFLTLISISICFAQTAYITNVGDGTVSVVNTSTNTITGTIVVGDSPYGICVSPDGSKVYVPNYSSNIVSVINTSTNTVTANITVGSNPTGICISPDGSKLYVANYNGSSVSVVNTNNNTVTSTITVGNTPRGLDLSPDGTKLYVANHNSNTISVINTTTNTVTSTIAGGAKPFGVKVSLDGSKVYVTNFNGSSVSVINASTNTISSTIAVGSNPVSIANNIDGSKIYVSNFLSASVSVINTATNTVTANISVSDRPYGIAMHPDGSKMYVATYTFSEVDVINTSNNSVTAIPGFFNCVSFGNFMSIYQPVTITGTSTVCSGSGTTLSANGTGTYQWSTGETTSSITVAPNTTTTYGLTVTSPYGYVSTLTKTVAVAATPTPLIAGPSTNVLCLGNSSTLTASGGNSFLWSTGSTNATINVTPTSTTTYSVTVTNSSNCTAAGSYGFTVPVLAVEISGNTNICQGSSTTLQTSTGQWGPFTYQWNDQSTNDSNTVSPTTNTAYSVTITSSAYGCTATADQLVSVTAPVQSNIYSGICSGQSYPFNGQNLTTSGTYTSYFQTSHGCDSIVELTLVVYGQIVPIISQSGNVLSTGLSTASYQWALNGDAIPGATTASYTPTQSGAYTVQLTENGCTSTSAVFNYVHVGIDNVWAEGTVLYPNPTDGMIYLNNFQASTIEVFSTDGRLLMTANNASSLNIASLTAGTYLVRCYNNDTPATVRVIKY